MGRVNVWNQVGELRFWLLQYQYLKFDLIPFIVHPSFSVRFVLLGIQFMR